MTIVLQVQAGGARAGDREPGTEAGEDSKARDTFMRLRKTIRRQPEVSNVFLLISRDGSSSLSVHARKILLHLRIIISSPSDESSVLIGYKYFDVLSTASSCFVFRSYPIFTSYASSDDDDDD